MGVDLPHNRIVETPLLILVTAHASFCPDVVSVPLRLWLSFRALCSGRAFILIISPQGRALQEKPGGSQKSRKGLPSSLQYGRIASVPLR